MPVIGFTLNITLCMVAWFNCSISVSFLHIGLLWVTWRTNRHVKQTPCGKERLNSLGRVGSLYHGIVTIILSSTLGEAGLDSGDEKVQHNRGYYFVGDLKYQEPV